MEKLQQLIQKQRQLSQKLNEYSKTLKELQDHNKLEEEDLHKALQLEQLIERIEQIELKLIPKNQTIQNEFKSCLQDTKKCLNDIKHEDIKSLIQDSENLFKDTSKLLEDIIIQ